MGRIIDLGMTPAKKRHAHMRSCAEVLRLLASRPHIQGEEKDMLAFLVFNLRGINETIDQSAAAWDEKNYWKKAEALREKWRWTDKAAKKLHKLIKAEDWNSVPDLMIPMIPKFSDITIGTMTRDSDWWVGAHATLMKEDAA